MQAAHNTGLPVYYPPGSYNYTTLTIPGGGIVGGGASVTSLVCTDATNADSITYTGAMGGLFGDFQMYGSGKPNGAAIAITGTGSGEVAFTDFSRVIFNTWPGCIKFNRASQWSIMTCRFLNYSQYGVTIDNQNNGDSGDSSIGAGSAFVTTTTTAVGIIQVSSGGLKLTNSKFNQGAAAYKLALGTVVGGTATSIILISNCSIEGMSDHAVQFARASGTATFSHVSINGCEFYIPTANKVGIYSVDTSGFLSIVNIGGGNTFSVTGGGTSGAMSLDYIDTLVIDGNAAKGPGGTSTGILVGTHGTNGLIGVNQMTGFGTAVTPGAATQLIIP